MVGESSKTKNGKANRIKKKKTGVCVQHYWQISFAFLRKFIFCCKYFNFLFVGCLNFEFTFICQLRGSYRRPSRSLSVYISPQQRRLSSSIDIYFPLFEYCCCSFFVTYRQIHLLKNPQNNNKNNNNEYTIKKRTERECCSATSDISVKLKENKSYYQKKKILLQKS